MTYMFRQITIRLTIIVVALSVSGCVEPTFLTPHPTGKIVFASEDSQGRREIYIMNPDGSSRTLLTSGNTPSWSSDGKQIAFAHNEQIYIINSDGSGPRQITHEQFGGVAEPDWSPDGSKLAYCANRSEGGESDIKVIDVGGNNPTSLTRDSWNCSPDWSPDGTKIVFDRYIDAERRAEIFVIGADGENMVQLTSFNTFVI